MDGDRPMSAFDIEKPPPTEQELEERRSELEGELAKLVRGMRRTWWGISCVAVLAATTLLWMWLEVRLPDEFLAHVIAIVAAVSFAGIVALGSHVVARFAGAITVCAVVVVGVALASVGGIPGGTAIVVAAVSVGGGIAVGIIIGVIDGPEFEAQAEILEESIRLLLPMELAHCPDVVNWCQRNRVVARYQNGVVRQGRLLVEGEYYAMRTWVETNELARASDVLCRPIEATA